MPLVDGKYEPVYRTERKQVEEWLSDGLPLYDYEANWGNCHPDREGWKKQAEYMQQIEKNLADPAVEVFAGNCGIWRRVMRIGIAVHWPFWQPRPAVIWESIFGWEWHDWDDISGVEIRPIEAKGEGAGR